MVQVEATAGARTERHLQGEEDVAEAEAVVDTVAGAAKAPLYSIFS
jgi:hypothetical protein